MTVTNTAGARPSGTPSAGSDSQAMQDSFGAEVTVTSADIGLYFVHGHGDGRAMHRALAASGAAIAARISTIKVLAVMHFTAFQQLRADRSIALIGPVALDQERFEVFRQVVGGSEPAS